MNSAMGHLLEHGAKLVHEPVVKPWGETNVRLGDPDGMQVTRFKEAENNE